MQALSQFRLQRISMRSNFSNGRWRCDVRAAEKREEKDAIDITLLDSVFTVTTANGISDFCVAFVETHPPSIS